jgi:SEC-C motif-containing protein
MISCYCGSGDGFADCCKPYLEHVKNPPTALALMRSRYSAYCIIDMKYIEATQGPPGYEPDEERIRNNREWAKAATWLGLEITRTEKGLEKDTEGIVEFIATYKESGVTTQHHETSTFKKFDDKWYFMEGKSSIRQVKSTDRAGRNDPCPCGSGKKYKKCCG